MLLPRNPNRLCEVVRRHGQHQSWKWLLGPQRRAACASRPRDICDWTPRRSTFGYADGINRLELKSTSAVRFRFVSDGPSAPGRRLVPSGFKAHPPTPLTLASSLRVDPVGGCLLFHKRVYRVCLDVQAHDILPYYVHVDFGMCVGG